MAARSIAVARTCIEHLVLQLVHGELTLDKHRMPGLFVRNVPEFPAKQSCAAIISNYVHGGAVVPKTMAFYRALIDPCADTLSG